MGRLKKVISRLGFWAKVGIGAVAGVAVLSFLWQGGALVVSAAILSQAGVSLGGLSPAIGWGLKMVPSGWLNPSTWGTQPGITNGDFAEGLSGWKRLGEINLVSQLYNGESQDQKVALLGHPSPSKESKEALASIEKTFVPTEDATTAIVELRVITNDVIGWATALVELGYADEAPLVQTTVAYNPIESHAIAGNDLGWQKVALQIPELRRGKMYVRISVLNKYDNARGIF